MLLRARFVYPVSAPLIEDGFVRVAAGRVTQIGEWSECADQSEVEELGDVILLPGFVNAHCHLDYTDFAGEIPLPVSFAQWLRAMVELKAKIEDSAHCKSWVRGARQAVSHGVTTLGNIETRRGCLMELWASTPLRLVSFMEIILLKAESDSVQAVKELKEWLTLNSPPRGKTGVSPHAPYTTKQDLLQECGQFSDMMMAMHVAESSEEDEMFRHGKGPLWQMLKSAGRNMDDCVGSSPLKGLRAAGLLNDRMLLVHGNYLNALDVTQIVDSRASVVHCPRSHEYFGHCSFPLKDFREAGVNLCLGSDSLASMSDAHAQVELFSEIQRFDTQNEVIADEDLIEMVTVNAARALGMHGEVGCLQSGAFADLFTLPYSGEANGVKKAIIGHKGPAEAVMIDGQWVDEYKEVA